MSIKANDLVTIKPEWQDEGDNQFEWIALEDEDGGRVKISPINTGLTIPPIYVVMVDWLIQCAG